VGTRDGLEIRNPAPPWVNTKPRSFDAGPKFGARGGAGSLLVAWDVIFSVSGGGGLALTAPATRKLTAATAGASLDMS